jgi:LacI family transcriptional regulator
MTTSQRQTDPPGGRAALRRRPTLKTIATETGLSLSTVSLALRDGSNLRKETREKVQQAAEALGYVPDAAGVRLRTGRANAVGLILDGREDSLGFSRNLIRGAQRVVRNHGMSLNVYPEFDRSETLAALDHLVRTRQVDGLILTHTEPQDPRVKKLLEADFPFVTHGRTELFTPHPFHDFDTDQFFESCFDSLERVGARDVLAVLADNKTFNHLKARRAFAANLARSGMSGAIRDDPVDSRDHVEDMRILGQQIAAAPHRADAIICDSELVALSIASGLAGSGLRIGVDIHMAAKQTSTLLPALFPGVICLRENVQASGEELSRLLFARLNGEDISQLQSLAAPI